MSIFINIVRFSFLLFIFGYLLTGISFLLYHVYYGFFIHLAYIMPYFYLNIISYTIIGFLLFVTYLIIFD